MSIFHCYHVDPYRKTPITCNKSTYSKEKEEGMILQVKFSLTAKSKTSVTVGLLVVWGGGGVRFLKKHLYIKKVKLRKH